MDGRYVRAGDFGTPRILLDLSSRIQFSTDQHRWRDEARRLLPTYHEDAIPSAIPAPDVTKSRCVCDT